MYEDVAKMHVPLTERSRSSQCWSLSRVGSGSGSSTSTRQQGHTNLGNHAVFWFGDLFLAPKSPTTNVIERAERTSVQATGSALEVGDGSGQGAIVFVGAP